MATRKKVTKAVAPGGATKKQKGSNGGVVVKQEKAPRSLNFTPQEDLALAKAYVSCTNNPLCGVEQKASAFYGEVADKFFVIMSEESGLGEGIVRRSAESLKNRWSKHIQPDMNKFLPYFRKIENEGKSGTPKSELIPLAWVPFSVAMGVTVAIFVVVVVVVENVCEGS